MLTHGDTWEFEDGKRYVYDEDRDLWWDEEGGAYVQDGDPADPDWVIVDPPEDAYDEADFRRDAGYL
jgi:hypothetical protein